MIDSRLFNRIQSPFHYLSHQKVTTLVGILEDIVMHSLYQITFVNALLFPDVYFILVDR